MLAFTEGKKVTNHSVRKTCISRLLDADVPENFAAKEDVLDPQQS